MNLIEVVVSTSVCACVCMYVCVRAVCTCMCVCVCVGACVRLLGLLVGRPHLLPEDQVDALLRYSGYSG